MEAIAQKLAEAIISSLALGLAIALVAWLLSRVLPIGRAGLRFGLWFGALTAIALMPVAQGVLQRLRGVEPGSAVHGLIVLPGGLATYLLFSWAAFASVGLGIVIRGALHIQKLRSNSVPVENGTLDPTVREVIERACQQRKFTLRASDQVRVPMAIGFVRPAVVFPADLLRQLPPDQLKQLLLHESTHLLRYDDWTNLLQKIVGALLFFHPAVWWLEKRLSLEREMACDEAVVAQTSDARAYAQCLASLAERSVLRRTVALVQAAVSRMRQTSLRVEKLLRAEERRSARPWAVAVSLVGVLSCSAVLVQAPELVTFRDSWAPAGAEASDLASVQQFAPRLVPALMTVRRPRAMQAGLKPALKSAMVRVPKPLQRDSKRTVDAFAKRTDQRRAKVMIASARQMHAVPVLLTTTLLVESGTPDGASQLWIVRTVRLAVFYPTPQQSKPEGSRKI
ncbi:MAG TPA: M56 family metallopeptidase [Terriglobales bacterium]|nr:M56 family metallopeptidase [Terriglobales bacterium]